AARARAAQPPTPAGAPRSCRKCRRPSRANASRSRDRSRRSRQAGGHRSGALPVALVGLDLLGVLLQRHADVIETAQKPALDLGVDLEPRRTDPAIPVRHPPPDLLGGQIDLSLAGLS